MKANQTQKSDRKKDHIDLAFNSVIEASQRDQRFNFEPMLSGHPELTDLSQSFLGKTLDFPVWISSMTGGTKDAFKINERLARLAGEFKLGMGLGSCRPLLESSERLSDFAWRKEIGDQPFYANLGIAQIETIFKEKKADQINELVELLETDGLIIHVNPLQEWAQPEGDRFQFAPIETIQKAIETYNFPIIVKEVGQGIGPASLKKLLDLKVNAIEFGALGGTNFTKLELDRSNQAQNAKNPFVQIGHTAEEMVDIINSFSGIKDKLSTEFIISGGVKDYLHGFYLNEKLNFPSIYGQASPFLHYALDSYDTLRNYFQEQMYGLMMAHAFLRVRA